MRLTFFYESNRKRCTKRLGLVLVVWTNSRLGVNNLSLRLWPFFELAPAVAVLIIRGDRDGRKVGYYITNSLNLILLEIPKMNPFLELILNVMHGMQSSTCDFRKITNNIWYRLVDQDSSKVKKKKKIGWKEWSSRYLKKHVTPALSFTGRILDLFRYLAAASGHHHPHHQEDLAFCNYAPLRVCNIDHDHDHYYHSFPGAIGRWGRWAGSCGGGRLWLLLLLLWPPRGSQRSFLGPGWWCPWCPLL